MVFKEKNEMKSITKTSLIASVALLGVVLAFGCGGDDTKNGATGGTDTGNGATDRPTIVLGRVPSDNPVELIERMEPLMSYLQDKLDINVKPELAKTYAEFTDRMSHQEYDLAFSAPFQYVTGHDESGYDAVLRPRRHGSDTYVGIIITARPAITSLQQLENQKIAFVDPNSTSGYLFPLGLLVSRGLLPDRDFSISFLGGHDNVVLNVLHQDYAAGATFEGAERIYSQGRANEIRVLARTEPIYNEPIAVSPKFMEEEPELANRIIDTLANMHKDPEGKEALSQYDAAVSEFMIADDSDYNSVRNYLKDLPEDIKTKLGL